MGVNEIIKKIKKDSDKIIADTIAEAKDSAKKIINGANIEAEKRKKAILESGEKQATLKKQRIIADAKLRSKRIEWDAKESLISEVLGNAKEELAQVKEKGHSGKSYSEVLLKLIKEAAINAGGGDLEIILSTGDSSHLSKDNIKDLTKELKDEVGKNKLTLSKEERAGLGGPIVKAKAEHIEVNNTLEERIERHSDSLRAEITKVLFGG
ncbi:MAG: V-type ATP synthase subunit E family protein [Halobacteriota archaeon]|nr:V-type ATP synthase subunit E family protein [Halobacteriota archaeon]